MVTPSCSDEECQQASTNAEPDIKRGELIPLSSAQNNSTLMKILANAGADDGGSLPALDVPEGFVIMPDGVRKCSAGKTGIKLTKITAAAIYISRVLRDLGNGTETFQFAWLSHDNSLRYVDLQPEHLSDKRVFASLIGFANAPLMQKYITDAMDFLQLFYRLNAASLPYTYVSNRLGWVEIDGKQKFVYDEGSDLALSPAQALQHHARLFSSTGSLAGWIEAVKPTMERCPRLLVLVLASITSPFLHLLNAPSFTIEVWGKTSSGKTTSLNIAASVWGKVGTGSAGLVTSWDNTTYYVEQLLQFHNAVPVFMMDCHKANQGTLEDVAYKLANGFGKGRGLKTGGVRERATWNCVLISDGERSLYSSFNNAGASARVLSLYGSPIEDLSAAEVQKVFSGVRANYGTVGKAVAELLQKADKNELEALFLKYCEALSIESQSGIEARTVQYFAAMRVALDVVCRLPELAWMKEIGENALQSVRLETIGTVQENLASKDSLSLIADWITSNPNCFPEPSSPSPTQIYGYRRNGGYAIVPEALKTMLETKGYDIFSQRIAWKEAHAIIWNTGTGFLKTININGRSTKFYFFKETALFPAQDESSIVEGKDNA